MKNVELQTYIEYLKNYDGPEVTFMEVCGSHTAAIAKSGIARVISPKIHLVSGPGCPVCVSPSGYVDRLIELAKTPDTTVCTFGDLLRIPGTQYSLNEAKGQGASVEMVYSPMDVIALAKEHPDHTYVFGAVGFETTVPVYTVLLDEIVKERISNIRLLTALKVMPPVIGWLCDNGAHIDGFIAPGHVSVITGSKHFEALSRQYNIPFAVTGFSPKELVLGIYGLLRMWEQKEELLAKGDSLTKNFYPSVVTTEGNTIAQAKVEQYFEPGPAVWRGMGEIADSGLYLRDEYAAYDAGSRGLDEDHKINKACRCDQVLMGKISSYECPLFGKVCTPLTPQGACMVSSEGSCYQRYLNR
ncbi:hydrogenase expression/formation protein HypD [Lachnospiraceae bacterium XBD2001]|nr:hydrogenase expression/formation protein HypD [Lachnospiraceae bacterium XBD2001]